MVRDGCGQPGVGMVRDGCSQPCHRTLKLTVSQEWVDGLNKFRKAESNFNDFWVDVVKIGRDYLVHETLKSAEWVYELNFFWPWCNNFGKTNIVLYIFDF